MLFARDWGEEGSESDFG